MVCPCSFYKSCGQLLLLLRGQIVPADNLAGASELLDPRDVTVLGRDMIPVCVVPDRVKFSNYALGEGGLTSAGATADSNIERLAFVASEGAIRSPKHTGDTGLSSGGGRSGDCDDVQVLVSLSAASGGTVGAERWHAHLFQLSIPGRG